MSDTIKGWRERISRWLEDDPAPSKDDLKRAIKRCLDLARELEQVREQQQVLTGNALDRDVENMRLKEEIERMKREGNASHDDDDKEIDRLKAENEKLRDVVRKAIDICEVALAKEALKEAR